MTTIGLVKKVGLIFLQEKKVFIVVKVYDTAAGVVELNAVYLHRGDEDDYKFRILYWENDKNVYPVEDWVRGQFGTSYKPWYREIAEHFKFSPREYRYLSPPKTA